MMNYIFALAVIFSFVTAVFTGNASSLSEGILEGAQNAVSIGIKLLGAMALWNGITEIMTESGLHKKIEKLLTPVIKLLFPTYQGTAAGEAICSNITANLLGLGNAATPLGIEAMRRIKAQSGSPFADNETVRFVVINSASLTLIPTTIAALRRLSGSTAPFSILIPVWFTGILSLSVGLIFEKILSKRWKI
ncbi:MAG: spore maturation protein A [Clostridia bacterium]|nr:spore maturation protein A [Clostridia bacterium]